MAATAMTVQDAVSALAAMCKPGEAALTRITSDEGLSWCIASEQTSHSVARSSRRRTDENLIGVAVIKRPDGTITDAQASNRTFPCLLMRT